MSGRKSISKKIRFEVLKRDSFTCQYCGGKAPEILLEVDHIEPVSKGGSNDIFNLITSCQSCNSGKSNILLSDITAIEKQRAELELLEKRRQQNNFLIKWKKELHGVDNHELSMLIDFINSFMEPFNLTENGRLIVKGLLKKYKFKSIVDAVEISANRYLEKTNNITDENSAEVFFDKIGGILHNKNKSEIDQVISYVASSCKYKIDNWRTKKSFILLTTLASELKKAGTDKNEIKRILNLILTLSTDLKDWQEWEELLHKMIEGKFNFKPEFFVI